MTSLPFPASALASSSSHLILASGYSIKLYEGSTESCSSTSPSTSSDTTSHTAGLIRHIAISPDDAFAVTLGDDKSLRVYALRELTLLSTRTTIKRGSQLSFSLKNDIIVSDKMGDVYAYPLHPPPSDPATIRPSATELASDPSRNPDASLLLGHVSVLTAHLITPDGKHIITADRDEHIRVSRYPQSHVIERYLYGTDGFISALHVPPSRSDILLSAGGEPVMRIWNWTNGEQVGSVHIWADILHHRCVRSSMRKVKNPRKRIKVDPSDSIHEDVGNFYDAPDGWMLPSGQGVCIKKIDSVEVDETVIVLFFSEGCAALHSFVLSSDPAVSPTINTLPLLYPILDFALIPSSGGRLLVSLDTAWGTLKQNQSGNEGGKPKTPKLTEEDIARMSQSSLVVVEVGKAGELSDVSSTSSSILSPLLDNLSHSSPITSPSTITSLNLYPDLNLLPRWPGFEEDDELAGPEAPGSEPIPNAASGGAGGTKRWTPEELDKMSVKQLGRLRAQGVDVGDIMMKRRKEIKARGQYEGGGGRSTEGGDELVGDDDA